MTRIKDIFVSHRNAIILAVLTSMIVALPQVYLRINHANDGIYQGIELLPDSPWSPRVREIQDGYGFGNIYYKDGKDDPYLFQPFGTMVWAYIGNIFSLDINNTFLVSRFLLTFLTSLLLYSFVYLVSREKFAALCSVVVILLADSILSLYGLTRIFHGMYAEEFLSIGKPVNNTMIYIPYFAFLIAFWFFYTQKKWYYGALSVMLLGINFYTYFYTWSFLYAFGGVLGLILIVQKKWPDVYRISGVYLCGALLSLPYFINVYHASQYSSYEVVSMRFGIVLSHAPIMVGFVSIIALIIFIIGFPRREHSTFVFGLALLVAPFVTMNQQIITGKVMQVGHYHWYFHKPLAVIFTLIILFYFLSRGALKQYKLLCALVIISVSIGIGLFTQIDSYKTGTVHGGQMLIDRQRYGPVMDWLTKYAEKDSVVFANDDISHATVVYTPLNVMYHRSAHVTLAATEERLLDALFVFYRLRDIDTHNSHSIFEAEKGYLSDSLYGVYYSHLPGSGGVMPEEKITEITQRYQEILLIPEPVWLQNVWSKYEVEYVVWDKKENPEWNVAQLPILTEAAVFGDIVIYRFSRDTMVSNKK